MKLTIAKRHKDTPESEEEIVEGFLRSLYRILHLPDDFLTVYSADGLDEKFSKKGSQKEGHCEYRQNTIR